MTGLTLRQVTRRFSERTGVDNVTLEIRPGEFFSLLGPSGSGKSTLLRIVAGLEHPDSGSVMLHGRDITKIPPQERGVGMVFQNYALFPHMTVYENVAFGLRLRNVPAQDLAMRVGAALERVGLAGRGGESVAKLSGGEQQRVAVARAIVIEPGLLLFDEPLSNLDVTLRQRTRMEIRALQKRTGITTLYVTHDQAEALSVSDRIAVIRNGRIEQTGTPVELYQSPATAFVARFLGWENSFAGVAGNGSVRIPSERGEIRIPWKEIDGGEMPVEVLLTPEMITLRPVDEGDTVAGVVDRVEFRGASSLVVVMSGDNPVSAVEASAALMPGLKEGMRVGMRCAWQSARIFPKEVQ
jgi:iron(III) transport system ATP-binding protein